MAIVTTVTRQKGGNGATTKAALGSSLIFLPTIAASSNCNLSLLLEL